MISCFLTLKKLEFAHKITREHYENLECKDSLYQIYSTSFGKKENDG